MTFLMRGLGHFGRALDVSSVAKRNDIGQKTGRVARDYFGTLSLVAYVRLDRFEYIPMIFAIDDKQCSPWLNPVTA